MQFKNKIKKPHKNGRPHGYWVDYYSNGAIAYKGHYKNGKVIGLWEYYSNSAVCFKEYYNHLGNIVGLSINNK